MRTFAPLVLSLGLLLVACGDDSNLAAEDGGATGSGGDAAQGGGAGTSGSGGSGGAGGVYTPETSELSSFTAAGSLLQRRDHHVSFVVDRGEGARFLYVQGGAEDLTYAVDKTERAPIGADGSLGAFEVAGPDIFMIGHAVAVRDDRILLFGGQSEDGIAPRSQVVPVAEDGSLGEPEEGPPMDSGRFHVAGVQVGDFVYAVGGIEDRDGAPWSTATVELVRFDDDGVGTWTETTSLPGPRSHHVVAAHGGYVYVAGGLDRPGTPFADVSLPDVLRAPIEEGGGLGTWEVIGTLPTDLAVAAATTHGDQLWIVGGLTNGSHDHGAPTGELTQFSTHVLRATVLGASAEAALGPWEIAQDLPMARGHAHQAPILDGVLYSVGGHGDDGLSQGEVFFARFE